MRLICQIIFVSVLFILCNAQADTIHVPADYPTIQQGIDTAVNGDIVLVAPGTYIENIDFLGKAITVQSSGGAEETVIDGNQAGSVVTFASGEDSGAVLDGFTLFNGSGTVYSRSWICGGGIYCFGLSSPTIIHNIISGNHVSDWGGGILCRFASSPTILYNTIHDNSANYGAGIFVSNASVPLIQYNDIHDNSAGEEGGGISCLDDSDATVIFNLVSGNTTSAYFGSGAGIATTGSSPLIMSNWVCGNSSSHNGGGIECFNGNPIVANNIISCNSCDLFGGGLYLHFCDSVIVNNTIFGNAADGGGGGLFCGEDAHATVVNSIIWNNNSPTGPQIMLDSTKWDCSLTISHSDLEGGASQVDLGPIATLYWGDGMIDADPLFVDAGNSDFHLIFISPCRASGNNASPWLPDHDFEGDPRIYQGTVDIGADEFYTHLYFTGDKSPGGEIQCKLAGLPGTKPVCLFIGSGILETPAATPYGDFYLLPPRIMIPLVPIPSTGVLVVPTSVPLTPSAPYDVPMQGLIGLNSDSLTNLYVLEVK